MLRRLRDVHGIQLNPLLVTVFVATSEFSRKDIPANITELFKKFTEMMLGRWDSRKGIAQQYQHPVKDLLLQQLAFYMHSNNITRIPLTECRAILDRILKDTALVTDLDILFDEIIYRSGLLRLEGDELSFRHMLLQEFFAGRAAPSITFLQSVLSQEWWQRAIVFYFGEHPSEHLGLAALITGAQSYTGTALYQAAVSTGLAAQACYLSKVTDRSNVMQWVIDALSRSRDAFLADLDHENPGFSITSFVMYYLYARDSVACTALCDMAEEKARLGLSTTRPDAEEETRVFWYIVSLIEAGHLDKAESLIRNFKPSDLRLLLALDMGCFMICHLRITPPDHKKIAERICSRISHYIPHLRQQVISEMKTMLLEIRDGKVHALPSPPTSSEPTHG